MPGPFPGMDPYLEMRWGDTSTRLIVRAADALNRLLPDGLAAEIDCERYPLPGRDDPITDRSLVILPLADDRPVTVVEFVNPWNRMAGPGQAAYERRRARTRSGGANLVEVELVRTGESVVSVADCQLPPAATAADYRVCVTRAGGARNRELYPVPLRTRRPVIAIPLRPNESGSAFDLQGLIDEVWDGGRRSHRHYGRNCVPPLSGPDAEWADALLRAAGRRP